MKKSFYILLLLLPFSGAFAQELERIKEPTPKELQFIGYSFTRMTASNVSPTNDILQGQVIGRLFGQNSTNTIPQTAIYGEQRFVPMFIYKPSILDGYATFRGLFKIDYSWGDQAYGVGNNRGGAINGGQINLQTLMANVDLRPDGDNWNIVIGMQRLFDNVRDPNVNSLTVAQTSGYKLSYWGTQAVGVSVFGNVSPTVKGRIGYFQLWENEIRGDDDVALWMADIESKPLPLLETGLDLWYLYDRGKGAGGISVLGQGLNSALADYNGAARIFLPNGLSNYEADLFWFGGHSSFNRDFLTGRWWADAYIMTNFGAIDTGLTNKKKIADVFGIGANASLHYKYGMTQNDKISLEMQYSSGDENGISDGTLNAVVTGNAYGSPVGIYSSHKALLLFPDPQVINRYYSAVHDISNMGLGVTAAFLNVYKDFIPNKLNAKIGLATAISNITPAKGSSYIGTELNAEVKYNLKVFLTLGVSAAYVTLGDFYNSPNTTYYKARPKDPWVFFTTLSWLMF
ncbi:MAG: hypothetical protein HYV28_02020 [Ignavibacteriales bacterium]|nr:hypothetical protein [Ignavibacteriales bacterium]